MGHGEVVDEQVERFVAVGLALDPLDALMALHIAGDLALDDALLVEVVGQVLAEVQRAGAFVHGVAVVDPVLGGVGADEPQLGALLVGGAAPGDVDLRRPLGEHRAAGPARALHRDDVSPAAQAGELVDLVGVVAAGVDGGGADGHLDAADVPVAGLELVVEQRPGALVGGVAHDHLMVDHPAFQPFAPAEHQQLQAVVLGVDGGGEDQRAARHAAQRVVLGAGFQLAGLGHLLGGVPQPGQTGVVEHLHGFEVALVLGGAGLVVLLGQPQPAHPAERRVQRVEGEADRLAVALGMGAPFAAGEHVALVVFVDQAAAGAAEVLHLAVVVGPLEVFPLQRLVVAAVRARHVVVALVALVEQVGDARGALEGGRAGEVDLGVAAEGTGAGFGQFDGVAFVVDVDVPAVDLVAVDVARGQLGEVGGGAGGGGVEGAALELLGVHGVARIARAR